MRWIVLLFSLLSVSAAQASAQCGGTDIRTSLPPADQAALTRASADTPYGEGNHWLASRGSQTIHVIGTMHLGDPRMDGPIERLTPVIEAADILLLEADKQTEAELMAALAERPEMILLDGTSLIELMPDDRWQMLAQAARERGIPPFMAARFQPWYLSLMLALPPCMMAQMKAKNGLDHRLMGIAEAAGVPTGSLEPFDTIFRVFGSEKLETQVEMMTLGLVDPARAEDVFASTTALYFEEQTAASWELSRLTAEIPAEQRDALFAQMQQELLTQRNRSWLPVILEQEQASTLVVAVGAAHLPGQDGVLALLAGAGFTLTRQPF